MPDAPVIVITGASSGIGEATARLFGQQGYRVVLAARRKERLHTLAEEIQARGPGKALPVVTDVSRLGEIQNLVDVSLKNYGQIDILFNNAGFGRLDWLENLNPVQDINAQIQVNLLGMIQTAHAVLPHMIERHSGHIVNMSSIAGLVATPTYSVYAASKFGIRGFTEALRREVNVYGIHVSGIYPGGTLTEFTDHAGIKRKTKKTTPAALRLKADDVARGVLSLVKRPRRMLVLPWPMLLGAWTNALFPGLMDWVIEQRFTKPERLG